MNDALMLFVEIYLLTHGEVVRKWFSLNHFKIVVYLEIGDAYLIALLFQSAFKIKEVKGD
jgi:hypothetical protein